MAKPSIHPTALVEKGAQLENDVVVGPFCTVGAHVRIGQGTRLVSHVVVTGNTTIGTNNVIYPFVSLGQPSPDRKYKGEVTTLTIGDNNDIRESVTMHIGTAADRGTTSVGNANLFMAGSHVAHDCIVGSYCTIANYAQLAGHVELADYVTIGGLTGIHQRVRVGTGAIIGGHAGVEHDVLPYSTVAGRRAALKGLNLVGLRRRGVEKTIINALDDAFTQLLDAPDTSLTLVERAKHLKRDATLPEVEALAEFILTSQRGITGYDDDE